MMIYAVINLKDRKVAVVMIKPEEHLNLVNKLSALPIAVKNAIVTISINNMKDIDNSLLYMSFNLK